MRYKILGFRDTVPEGKEKDNFTHACMIDAIFYLGNKKYFSPTWNFFLDFKDSVKLHINS
ncbi:hypothetical protein D5R40_17620 [Okeania hirsuta]|uniref:Uncharacterized protein n=1 Tax=Okeania hirsuta TaxID=1458930 RepID=A0A3N6PRI0_9CYAN|nr:hypothetical protein D5R40_17620 [Okeania hirsuta]